jgi:HKD family nuclease
MKGYVFIIAGILWIVGLFYCYKTLLKKSVNQGLQFNFFQSDEIKRQQKQQAEETWQRQKRLMEDRKRRARYAR